MSKSPIDNPGVGGFFMDVEDPSAPLQGFFHALSAEETAMAKRAKASSVPWIEVLGAVLWVERFEGVCSARRVLLALDADTAVLALSKAFSSDPKLLDLIRRFRLCVARGFIVVRVRSIVGVLFNEIADHLSHGRVQEAVVLAWASFHRRLVVVHI